MKNISKPSVHNFRLLAVTLGLYMPFNLYIIILHTFNFFKVLHILVHVYLYLLFLHEAKLQSALCLPEIKSTIVSMTSPLLATIK